MTNRSQSTPALLHRLVCALVVVSLLAVTSAFAQTAVPKVYDVELVVPEGKKSVETDADITFTETGIKVLPDKAKYLSQTKEFAYKDIKQADHSYSKKPMLSGGGAIATALLVGFIFAIPFLFIKKKKHWITVQTEKEFAVIKLGDQNYRSIVAEFETHSVKVNDLKEEGK
jgi:hypothetical protein